MISIDSGFYRRNTRKNVIVITVFYRQNTDMNIFLKNTLFSNKIL